MIAYSCNGDVERYIGDGQAQAQYIWIVEESTAYSRYNELRELAMLAAELRSMQYRAP